MHGRFVPALFIAVALFHCDTASSDAAKKIVLIGGAPSEGPGRHDYPDGIRLLKALLESSPDLKAIEGLEILAYPEGWPKDTATLDDAASIVWYFDGLERHPLLDAARRARFENSMKRGAGLVALHQASTVPDDDKAVRLGRWLGGARHGMPDRVTETLALAPLAPSHPVSRGVERFEYHDEFFPTFRFAEGGRGITPILAAPRFTAAWAFERHGGGRSFAFSGAHYLVALDQPMVRKMVLNAIVWSAGLEVPKGGVRSAMPDEAMKLTQSALRAAARKVPPASADSSTFHRDAQRTGWNAGETVLTPENGSGASFGPLWESPQLDGIGGQPPRLYATPLYIDKVRVTAGAHKGGTFPVVFAATSAGFVYAINAFKSG